MTSKAPYHVYPSHNEENRDFVDPLARQLQGNARLSFWFGPWHSIPGQPVQERMEEALWAAGACAVFIGGSGPIQGWQNEQMRTAIQTRVEDEPTPDHPVLTRVTAPLTSGEYAMPFNLLWWRGASPRSTTRAS